MAEQGRALDGVAATSLIPLYVRALESRRPDALLRDEKAVALVERSKADFAFVEALDLDEGDRAAIVLRSRELDRRIRARFPFRFTAAQDRAVAEILGDLRAPEPMNRLLQGDVGSGKTAVALYAALVCVANRAQAAFLAPTEILARQHHNDYSRGRPD